MHFLALPIEDAFLEDMEAGVGPRAPPVPAPQPGAAGGGLRLQVGGAEGKPAMMIDDWR
jgi:hypothetical protein